MIKFRIWDNQYKHYIYENGSSLHCTSRFCIDVFTGELIDVVTAVSSDEDFASITENPKFYLDNGIVIGPRYEVEQWTGLKDKKEKEIYVGDIVKSNIGTTHQFVFEHGRFCLSGDWCDFEYEFSGQDSKMIEVVGNMRENPELLKQND